MVRFFHPSDEGAACDWNRFAVAAVGQIEGAADPQELAARLRSLFAPVAPTLRISRAAGEGGGAPPVPDALLPPKGGGGGLRTVAWRHYGVLLDQQKAVFGSERIDDRSDLGWANLAQAVPARALRGRKVRLSAAIDAEVVGRGKAQLWLRVDRAGGQRGFFDNMADRPVREPGWRTVEIAGTIDPDAESIAIGLAFTGAGRVRIDDVKLESADDGPPVQAPLRNTDFRNGEAKRQPPGWTFPYESVRAGYRLGLLVGPPCRDGGCAEIEAGPIADPPFAKPADTLALDLGAGLRAQVPITLYADEKGTLPHAATKTSCVPGDAGASVARSERLAALLLAWGTVDLFRAYRELDGAPPGWGESLHAALPDALAATDERAFLSVFRRMLARLADGNAHVSRNGLQPTHRLPIEWRFLDANHLYITEVLPGLTDPHRGELVAAVDGEPVSGHHLLQGGEAAGATPEARRAAASQSFLYGDAGSPVSLDIRSGRDNVRRVELERNLPLATAVAPPKPGPIAELRPGVLYLDLGRLDDGAFEAALPRLAAAQGLVFDLRDGTDVSNKLISHLMPGPVLGPRLLLPVRLRPDGPPLSYLETFWTLFPLEPTLAARCAFLMDETDSGYSETLLAIVAHERRCELVGSTTGGTNGSLNVMNLPGGYTLTFTGLKILNPDGSRHYGVGIPPTIPVQPTPMEIAAGWDAALEKGLDAVANE